MMNDTLDLQLVEIFKLAGLFIFFSGMFAALISIAGKIHHLCAIYGVVFMRYKLVACLVLVTVINALEWNDLKEAAYQFTSFSLYQFTPVVVCCGIVYLRARRRNQAG